MTLGVSVRSIGVVLGVALLTSVAHAAGSRVSVSYQGDADPISQEWALKVQGDLLQAFLNIMGTSIPDDQGLPVWQVSDQTPLANVYYEKGHSGPGNPYFSGFTLRARVRVIPQATPIDPAEGLASLSIGYAGFGHTLLLGANAGAPGDGNLRVQGLGLPGESVIPGGSVYHWLEIVYDPVAESADVFVDGTEIISDWMPNMPAFTPVRFGAYPNEVGGTGAVRWNEVEMIVNLTDCEDGIDNDGDSLVDADDPGCESSQDGSEVDAFRCNDGNDDDGDGLVDLADPGCHGPRDETEFDVPASAPGQSVLLHLEIEPFQNFPQAPIPHQFGGLQVAKVAPDGSGVAHIALPSIAGTRTLAAGSDFVRVEASLPAGTLRLAAPGPDNTLPLRGDVRLCLMSLANCEFAFPWQFEHPYFDGMGQGGTHMFGTGASSFPYTLMFEPWTVGTVMVPVEIGSTTVTTTRTGFVHGPASATSTITQLGGVVQLVTPMRLDHLGGVGPRHDVVFARLRVIFLPEPRVVWMLVPALGLLFLGWRKT